MTAGFSAGHYRPIWLAMSFSLFLFLFFGARAVLLGADIGRAFVRMVPTSLLGFALSVAGLWVQSAIRPRRWYTVLGVIAAIALPCAWLSAKVGNTLVFAIDDLYAGRCQTRWCLKPDDLPFFAEAVTGNVFIYASLFLIHFWMASVEDARAAERRAADARDAAREAHLRALRYQVNPHFLFNSLNSLSTLVGRGDRDAAEGMIREMSAFLRYGLAADPIADVELEDEVEMQRRYLEIERRRFAHRLTLEVEIADDVRRARVPSLILQPLVENAVKHGVASTSAPVTVAIRAARVGTTLALSVEDDAPSSGVRTSGFGIGLRNVADRLATRFGATASLAAAPGRNGGYRAALTLPLLT